MIARIPNHLAFSGEFLLNSGPGRSSASHTFVRASDSETFTFYLARIIRCGLQHSLAIVDGTSLPAMRIAGSSVANNLLVGDAVLLEPALGLSTGPGVVRWQKISTGKPATVGVTTAHTKAAPVVQGSGYVSKVFPTGGGLITSLSMPKTALYFGDRDIASPARVNALVRFLVHPDPTRGSVAKVVTVV